MTTVAIVQARMGSSRLPGKVLADIGGMSMLARVVARLRAASSIDDIVIATSTHAGDDEVVREANRLEVDSFRGSETDVLARYLGAARQADAEVIVRVTSDCPLLDPGVVDLVVEGLRWDVDYASNTHRRTYPRGLDVEALYRDTLERIAADATSAQAREHVTAYVLEAPHQFRVRQICDAQDHSDLRWTVDTLEDLEVVRGIYELIGSDQVSYRRLVERVRAQPRLIAHNAHVIQKQVHVG
jgi:spore coat polysaccharide biosynthesis protein SpsF